MKTLNEAQINLVSGAVSTSEANQRIGTAVGTAYHAMTSTEAAIGGIFGLGGAIVGAMIHMSNNH